MKPNELRDLYPDAVSEIEREAVKKYLDQQRQEVDRFTFYRTFWAAIRQLPRNTRAGFVLGLLDYVFTGVEPTFEGSALAVWIGIKPNIDNSIDAILKGKTGGRPRKDAGKNKVAEDVIQRIVAYLNKKTGKAFKASSKKTISLIKARISEGFTEQDFYRVIDNMVARWRGSGDMEDYLRPETLFGTKFEGYLNSSGKSERSYDEYK